MVNLRDGQFSLDETVYSYDLMLLDHDALCPITAI